MGWCEEGVRRKGMTRFLKWKKMANLYGDRRDESGGGWVRWSPRGLKRIEPEKMATTVLEGDESTKFSSSFNEIKKNRDLGIIKVFVDYGFIGWCVCVCERERERASVIYNERRREQCMNVFNFYRWRSRYRTKRIVSPLLLDWTKV
jgi:hypothetical protein